MACEYTVYGKMKTMGKEVIQAPQGETDLGTKAVAIGATSARSDAFPAGAEVIILTASANCRVKVGDETVDASNNASTLSRLILAGIQTALSVTGGNYIAVIEE